MCLSANGGLGGIDSVRRKNHSRGIEVGGGEAEFVAELIAVNYFSGNGISAAKHLAGGIEIICADGFADARAADGLSIKRHGGKTTHMETKFCAERLEQRDIAAAFVPEDEIRADTDALDAAEFAR